MKLLDRQWRRFQALSLALEGMRSGDIAAATGLSRANVLQICSRAGVRMSTSEPKAAQITRAVMAVASGACVADAASDHGVSMESITRVARQRGVSGVSTSKGRRDGRSRRAASRVLFDGMTIGEASRAERCSTSAVVKMIAAVNEWLR